MVVSTGVMFGLFCTIVSILSIALNVLFLIVTHLTRVEGFQEVLIFMRNISVAYILLSLTILAITPQSVWTGSSLIQLPHGLLNHAEPQYLNGLASFGCATYLYAVLCFCIMFLYRYNVTCKTSAMSSIFSRRNITAFLISAGVFCFIQAVLFYYSAVDPSFLMERLNRTKDLDAMDLRPQFENLFGLGQTTPPSIVNVPPNSTLRIGEDPAAYRGPNGDPALLLRSIGVFGFDYSRNPVIFLAVLIFGVTNVLASIVILISSLIVSCKLRGHQESMSDKSQKEHKKLTNVLILDAYIPVLCSLVPAVNFVICAVRHDSMLFQEYCGMLFIVPLGVFFPALNVFLIPALRSTAFQVIFCVYWRNRKTAEAKAKSENAAANQEDLNQAQLSAIKSMSSRAIGSNETNNQ
ncbi:hypothetical protein M3Y99_01674100 [Aphelenchoides fujianensis]|nr:hypothetical protein M3Y99_01674100 [Aphelenchoides fujianensis]